MSRILVGRPELCERLALRRNRSLYSHIHHRVEISALTPEDATEYLRMRMERAGCTREVLVTCYTAINTNYPICGLRRTLEPHTTQPMASKKQVPAMPPLLAKLVAEQAATGLPPAYLPKDNLVPDAADESGGAS